MIALYIIGGIVLLLLIILMLRIKIYFLYYGSVLQLEYSVLGFRFEEDLVGTEEADILIEDFTEKQKVKSAVRKKKLKKVSKTVILKETLIILRDGVISFWKRFRKYAKLEKYMLKINLGTNDPAKTAVLYGSLSGVVCSLHEFAQSIKKRSRKADCVYTEFTPDFYADKTDIAVEIGFSLRIWQFIICLIIISKYYSKYERLPMELRKNLKGDTEDERILS